MHTLWTSAAPALSDRLYAEEWHLSPVQATGVPAIYPLFVVGTRIVLGGLSDHVGRRWTMLAALVRSFIGALTLAWALNINWLLAARAVMGIGVGLASGASPAPILESSPAGDPERAASATNLAQAPGFATALLLGGALIQHAPFPLRLDFVSLAAVIAMLIMAVWSPPATTTSCTISLRTVSGTRLRWRRSCSTRRTDLSAAGMRCWLLMTFHCRRRANARLVLRLKTRRLSARRRIVPERAFRRSATVAVCSTSVRPGALSSMPRLPMVAAGSI